MVKYTFLPALLLLNFSAPLHAANTIHWSYEGANAPAHWGELSSEFRTCNNGSYQSPININHIIEADLPPLKLAYEHHTGTIVNNGHTIQVTTENNDHFMLDNQLFTLKQFHFHTPSENHIKDKAYPLEAHFVHANANGALAVVAVMFKEGAENKQLETILNAVPKEIDKTVDLNHPIDVAQLLPKNTHYYRFSGSLTTPPCTEGVRWIVMKEVKTLSKKQINEFRNILKTANNRPLQPLNGRLIAE